MNDIVSSDEPSDNLCPEFTFIYGLKCPIAQCIRYVGKANAPEWRFRQHLAKINHEDTHKSRWLKWLRDQGLKPELELIEKVPFAQWNERELFWILHYRQLGYPLTNTYFGFAGPGVIPLEMRMKLSAERKGVPKSPESVAKSAATRRGIPLKPESIAKRTATRRANGWRPSPAHIAAVVAANVGKKRPPITEATRRKLSESHKGIPNANKGKKFSSKAVINTSLGQRRRYANKKNPPNTPTLWD